MAITSRVGLGLLAGAGMVAGLAAPTRRAAFRGASEAGLKLVGKGADGTAVVAPSPGAKFTVVAMTSTTCPVGSRYGGTLARLEKAYAAKGVRFVFVNPERDATEPKARADALERNRRVGLLGPYLDADGPAWARALGARTTTEMFVLDPKGVVRYRGAVDDQYGIGTALPAPRNRYLADALDALLVGRSPKAAKRAAPGCALGVLSTTAIKTPAYFGGVERVFQANCLSCHRPDGPAPFALDSFAATKARAPMVRYVVEKGLMPPWFAAKGVGEWANDRTLSPEDRQALLAWADGGTPKGPPALARNAPKFEPNWTIGRPDVEFPIPTPIAVAAEGTMPYQNVSVPTNYDGDRWLRRIEVLPGDRRVVHHVLVFADLPGQRREEGLGSFFGAYVPGQSALVYGPREAKRLPKGASLRFQIHYTPNGKATTDRTRIGLVFAPAAPEREVRTLALANVFFQIPPNAPNYPVTASFTSPLDAEILSFIPHMHLRGKAARYEMVRNGARTTLLDVPRYDFNWQLNYVAKEPVRVRRGDKLIYTAWYDNSSGNPANPDPKQTVGWGEQTFDEMNLGYIEYVLAP